jgi:hypothetical protein
VDYLYWRSSSLNMSAQQCTADIRLLR